MTRHEYSEGGLPCPEVRRQILRRAGNVLNEARDLLTRLDRGEILPGDIQCPGPGTKEEHRPATSKLTDVRSIPAYGSDQSLAV